MTFALPAKWAHFQHDGFFCVVRRGAYGRVWMPEELLTSIREDRQLRAMAWQSARAMCYAFLREQTVQ